MCFAIQSAGRAAMAALYTGMVSGAGEPVDSESRGAEGPPQMPGLGNGEGQLNSVPQGTAIFARTLFAPGFSVSELRTSPCD